MIHLGFTGTRHGLTDEQRLRVLLLVHDLAYGHALTAHHGLCVGADAEFHDMVRAVAHAVPAYAIIGHPGPDWPSGKLCAAVECDQLLAPLPHMKRNSAIVAASHVMIAAPFEDEPQPRGGTWATIGMARRALRQGKLRDLCVVGRGGELLDHARWP